MKKLILALTALSLSFVACSDDDNNNQGELTEAQLPAEIRTYVSDNFPTHTLARATTENRNNETYYMLAMSENLNLEFNGSYEITDIDDDSQLPPSVIPQAILDYVAQHYPNNFVTDWELEEGYQEVELDNGLELEFTLDGTFIRVDDDNDDDDETEVVLAPGEIPTQLLAYVIQYFPESTIIRAIKETDDNTVSYELYLSGNFELEFNEAFEITSIEGNTQLPDAVIPAPILDYVNQNYPNNFIVEWELEDDNQQVELDNGLELEFTLTGEFIGIDND